MKQPRVRLLLLVVIVVLVVENAWLAYPAVRDWVLEVERSDVREGRELAERLGCFVCHGPGGTGGVSNPGSQWDTVPAFHQQTPMMFVHDDDDVRQYILDGAPAAKRARQSYRDEMAAQAIRMPSFRGWVSEREVDALVAYVRAASELLAPADPVAVRGAEIVRKNGCFACHGEMGGGGLPNPGSFKGYIPGFIGPDFADLVRSDEELLEWIREGTVARLADHPIASRFLERQRIQMPAYERFLNDEEIEAAAAYVRWLAAGTWRTQPLVRE
jgi:mono/diheme cytochrome c family protein